MSEKRSKGKSNRLTYTAAALKGIGDRRYQEDTYAIVEREDHRALLTMVADGMGGMQDGRQASRTAVQVVRNSFMKFDMHSDIAAQLNMAMTVANNDIYARLHSDGGSTGIACLFCDEGMYYAGVGDSSLMLRRGEVIYHLNRKQNIFTELCMRQIRDGSMDSTIAFHHPERRALVGYLGMRELKDIDCYLRPLQLMSGDTIILCSDGIGDVLGDEELSKYLSVSTPAEACRRIEDRIFAMENPNQDNYTAVIVRCD